MKYAHCGGCANLTQPTHKMPWDHWPLSHVKLTIHMVHVHHARLCKALLVSSCPTWASCWPHAAEYFCKKSLHFQSLAANSYRCRMETVNELSKCAGYIPYPRKRSSNSGVWCLSMRPHGSYCHAYLASYGAEALAHLFGERTLTFNPGASLPRGA